MIPFSAFLLDGLMENAKPGPCNAIARVLAIPCCKCHCGDNAIELPITRSDRSKLDSATTFQFPINGTPWGGPLQGLFDAVSKNTKSDV